MAGVEDLRATGRCLAFVSVALAAGLAAQQPAPADKPEPVALVGRAEKLLQKKETEDAILLLWQALDGLAERPSHAVHEATALSARFLLQENDPREAERRRVFASVAKQQVELATAYRTRKWLEVAASRLAIADRFDRDAGAKERALLAAAQPKSPPAPPTPPAAPAVQPSPLLLRANTVMAAGNWRQVGDTLEGQAPMGDHLEWVTKATHEDHEVVVEFRPADAAKEHNATLAVGLAIQEGTRNFSGYRFQCNYNAGDGDYGLALFAIRGMTVESLGQAFVKPAPTTDGFRRLSIQVRGNRLRAQLDQSPPIEVAVADPVRGKVGLLQGVADSPTCPVQFRNLRIDPLPADQPSDDELRAKAEAANQNAITKAVDEAKELLQRKQPEAASLRLREALQRVDDMPAGVLRDNLKKTIEPMLTQADPLAPKRQKTAQAIAGELAALADQYATAGMARAALALTTHAASFDPAGMSARLAAAREKVQQWNVAQATARAGELAPPADDGTVLREWFAKGRRLDTRGQGMVVEGASARVDNLAPDSMVAWLPHPLAAKLTKASVHVHLPANGAGAGLCFDVVDVTHFAIALVQRRPQGLRLSAFLMLGGKWVPLLQREIPMDAWRLDAWHKITVESTETGLVARCGDTEIRIARKMLGKATGLFGLYADNGHDAALGIELRAFQPGP